MGAVAETLTEDISFVVQGPVVTGTAYSTRLVLQSIRENFPGSQIILSTWQNAKVDDLDYDTLLLNQDPGGLAVGDLTLNINRLIISTVNGIKKCTTKYVVKTRTDVIFSSNALLKKIYLIDNNPIKGKYPLFGKKIISTSFYVRDPLRSNLLFHPSDIFFIGQKEDILTFFDQPLATIADLSNDTDPGKHKIANEQYLFSSLINKIYYRPVAFSAFMRFMGIGNFTLSERFIFNSFRLFTPAQLGIVFHDKLAGAFPELNYSERAIKWFPLIRSLLLADIIYFRMIRPLKYARRNVGLKQVIKHLFKNSRQLFVNENYF